ncbi:MAG: TolC family protein [Rickettsiales bacterium]|jgi:TolC family type I secretion outer membrane protein|nr:TolC family protein [Rickettsiales bacterium]
MRKIFYLAAILCLFPALAKAGGKAGAAFEISKSCNITKNIPADALDLSDALELAMCNNPATRQAWLNTKAGDAAYKRTLGAYLPKISVSGTIGKSWRDPRGPDSGATETTASQALSGGLSASWLLYDFGRREAGVTQAYQSMNSANFRYSSTLQQAAFDVISAYYNTLSAIEALAAVKANEEATLKSFELAGKKFELGMASKADKLQTETTYVQAQLDTTRQEQVLLAARANLSRLMGLPPNMGVEIVPSASAADDELLGKSVEEIIETAMARRPDLAAMAAEVKASYAGVRAASAEYFPSISAFADKTWYDDDVETHRSQLDRSGYNVGVRLSVPIFTGFENTYSLRNARYRHAAQKEEFHKLEQEIELSVVNAYNDYKTSLKSLALANKMYESATENEQVALGSYKAGKGDIIRLMEAQGKLMSARKEKIAAQYGVYTYKIALLKAAGELNLKTLGAEK